LNRRTTSTSLVPQDARPLPGSVPLRNDAHERFAFKRAALMPKAEAYRQAGFTAHTDHAASGNASKLERRNDVADRIAYLRRQDEAILRAKRGRIEEFLWGVHDASVVNLWETVEVECLDKQGNPITKDGKLQKRTIQRPRLLSELPEEVASTIETCGPDEHGRVIPKPYSKMTANQELRKLLGIGVVTGRDESDELLRLSDADLIARLAQQARELGIHIDLGYFFNGGGE
jgi:hypothetical protein